MVLSSASCPPSVQTNAAAPTNSAYHQAQSEAFKIFFNETIYNPIGSICADSAINDAKRAYLEGGSRDTWLAWALAIAELDRKNTDAATHYLKSWARTDPNAEEPYLIMLNIARLIPDSNARQAYTTQVYATYADSAFLMNSEARSTQTYNISNDVGSSELAALAALEASMAPAGGVNERWGRIVEAIERRYSLNNGDTYILWAMSLIHSRKGNVEQSERCLEEWISLGTDEAAPHLLRAWTLINRGLEGAGIEELAAAARLDATCAKELYSNAIEGRAAAEGNDQRQKSP